MRSIDSLRYRDVGKLQIATSNKEGVCYDVIGAELYTPVCPLVVGRSRRFAPQGFLRFEVGCLVYELPT